MEENKGKTALVLTFNNVCGYEQGVYKSEKGSVVVVSNYGIKSPPDALCNILAKMNPPISLDEIGKVYFYIGAGIRGLLPTAEMLSKKGKDLTLIVCDCWNQTNACLDWSWTCRHILTDYRCGGQDGLGGVVQYLLAGRAKELDRMM